MAKVIYGKTNKHEELNEANPKPAGLFTSIDNSVQDSISSTTKWSSNQEKFYKLRMRQKKKKTFPFVGSSNIRMPTAEIALRKAKAGIMGQVFGIRPVVATTPTPSGTAENAQNIEKFLDHLVMDVIKIEHAAEILVDQSLEKGFVVAKVFWDYELVEREETVKPEDFSDEEFMAILNEPIDSILPIAIQRIGVDTHDSIVDYNLDSITAAIEEFKKTRKEVKFTLKDIIKNCPGVAICSPERIYVPVDSGFDIQKATSITHEFYLPLSTIKANAENKGWDKEVVKSLNAYKDVSREEIDKMTDSQKDTKEGIDRIQNQSELVRVWETYGLYDIDDSGTKKKSMITSFPDFKSIARKNKINSMTGRYPFVKFFYELNDDRWFAHRGIPELLEDIIKEIDVQHNMKIDSQTIRNAPMFIYRAGMINPNLVSTIPNQAIPVNGLQPLQDTIQVLNMHNPNTEFSYEREQQILEGKVQEMVGQIDYNLQSQINRREPRTLGEVEAQAGAAAKAFSLDAKHYIESFSDLFSMIFEEWSKNGDDYYEFNYFGDSINGQTIKLTKEELQGKYNVKVRGNDQNTNPQVKLQKAQQIVQTVTNPVLIQSGVVTPDKIANGIAEFLKLLDIDEFEKYINIKPQQAPPPDPTAQMQIMGDQMTASEVAQILEKRGIQPDIEQRRRDEKSNNLNNAADISSKLRKNKSKGDD